MPIILATREAEIRRIVVQGQPGQMVHETPPISKITRTKMDWRSRSSGRVPALRAQSPKFKPQSHKKKKKRKERKRNPTNNKRESL
jgi:hypothetical protein